MAVVYYNNCGFEVDHDTQESVLSLQEYEVQFSRMAHAYSESFIGGVLAPLKLGITMLVKFMTSFQGLLMSVVTSIVAIFAKMRGNKRSSGISSGGGGVSVGSSSSFDALRYDTSALSNSTGTGITKEVVKGLLERKEETVKQMCDVVNHSDRLTVDKIDLEALRPMYPTVSDGMLDVNKNSAIEAIRELTGNGRLSTATIDELFKAEDLHNFIEIDVDRNVLGIHRIKEPQFAPILRDVLRTRVAYDNKVKSRLNGIKPKIVNSKMLASHFEDIARIIDVPNTDTEFVNFLTESILSYSEYLSFISAHILLGIPRDIERKNDDTEDMQLSVKEFNDMLKKHYATGDSILERIAVRTPDKLKRIFESSKQEQYKLFHDLLLSSSSIKYKIPAEELPKVISALDNINTKAITEMSMDQLDIDLVEIKDNLYNMILFDRKDMHNTRKSKIYGACIDERLRSKNIASYAKNTIPNRIKETKSFLEDAKKMVENVGQNLPQDANVLATNALNISKDINLYMGKVIALTGNLSQAALCSAYTIISNVLLENAAMMVTVGTLANVLDPDEFAKLSC